jgi:hypothetical protein
MIKDLPPYQTHASLALIGFGTMGAVAGNTALSSIGFGGLGILHTYLFARLAIADWQYERERRRVASDRRALTLKEPK